MRAGVRGNSEFCWINVLTPDPDAARGFFARVLGWAYLEIPGKGHRIQVGGHDVGAIFDLGAPQVPPGTPAGIGVMVKVASADATAERVRALGGTAKPAFDIGPQGRMAECYDLEGANFDVWEPRGSPGTTVDSTHHGAPSWFEVLAADPAQAREFYTTLFGWTAEAMPMGAFEYSVFTLGETQVGGLMPLLPELAGVPPHWAVYFTVDDPDASARTAGELGATLFVPPQDIPGVGRFAGIRSPQGVHCYVIRYAEG